MKKVSLLIVVLITFLYFSPVSALEIKWPVSPMGTQLTNDSKLMDLVKYVYEWGIFLGGVAAFISLVFGGFLYLTSAGDPGKLREAKDRIFSAIVGLVLLLTIYLILNTINPELTILNISEMATACDTDSDCPQGTTCIGDPMPNDGNKQGSCFASINVKCDTDADCPEPNPDPDPEENFICKGDPNKGDGNPEGTCAPACIKAIFYENNNFGGSSFELTPGSGCSDVSGNTINSIDIHGACLVHLYRPSDCPSDTSDQIAVGQDTDNLKDDFNLSDTDFDSAKVEEFSF